MREQISKGKWYNSRVFEDVVISAEMGIPVSSLWEWSEDDQAFIIAFYRVKATMQAYEQFLHDREMSRNQKSKKNQGGNKPRKRRRR